MSECTVDEQGRLRFRGRKWVPNDKTLRTRIIQETHDSVLSGHPGREALYKIVAREFFWPDVASFIRRFVRNCDLCGSNKVWREKKHGLLKSLPIPERIWREVSVDFIEQLPLSNGCSNIMVIRDRLGKGVWLEAVPKIDSETVARIFLQGFLRVHGLPYSIVSDRGSAFIGQLWKRVCELLGIRRLLSTAHHPETDGNTEHINAEIEAYLRMYVGYDQNDWQERIPAAQLALNARDSSSTGISPFFLEHRYNLEILNLDGVPVKKQIRNPRELGELIVRKLKDAREWA
jgi:hypothetical protein